MSLSDLLVRKSELEDELSWQRRVAVVGGTYVERERAVEKVTEVEQDLYRVLGAISNISAARRRRLVKLFQTLLPVTALVAMVAYMAWSQGLLRF